MALPEVCLPDFYKPICNNDVILILLRRWRWVRWIGLLGGRRWRRLFYTQQAHGQGQPSADGGGGRRRGSVARRAGKGVACQSSSINVLIIFYILLFFSAGWSSGGSARGDSFGPFERHHRHCGRAWQGRGVGVYLQLCVASSRWGDVARRQWMRVRSWW